MTLVEVRTSDPELVLRELTVSDAAAYYDLIDRNRDHLGQHGDYREERTATLAWVRESLQAPSNGLRFGLWYRGALAGRADLHPKEPGHFVLGYWLGANYVGKGLMTTALEALMRHGRQALGATDFFAGVTHGNWRSVAVLRRLGFEVEAEEAGYTRFRAAARDDHLPRRAMDAAAYERRSREGPCFICETLAGNPDYPGHIVWADDDAVALLARYNTLLGHTLVAPRAHREQVTGDFGIEEYLDLQRLVYQVGEALRRELPTERLYVMSLGSQSGNRHVHWHVAPLPPGVPYDQQQLAAFSWDRGVLDLPDEELAALAGRIGARVERMRQEG